MRQLGLARSTAALALVACVSGGWTADAHAQFKWRDAQGRINYGDRLPDHPVDVLRAPKNWQRPGTSAAADNASLPYELRILNQRYPVVLYTTSNCAPCDLAREHLNQRGVPFTEKTVVSRQDLQAFESLGYPTGTGLPVVTVGAERQIGFHDARWKAVLDTAGYPEKSRLPAGYAQTAAQPLAAVQQPPAAETPAPRAERPRARSFGDGTGSPSGDADALRF